ncbi:MAG TPA: TonB-dependent receptor [Clostridiales bacterium]|nr:TonB-dependent receptor [Clostridiales bacterium]HQP68906.1 TonB-dependent receptor [Clostridiales bacterium]
MIILKTIFLLLIAFYVFELHGATVSGHVRDAATNEAVSDVNVFVEGTRLGSATNINGYFVISGIKAGNYTIKAEAVGYKQFIEEITLTGEQQKKMEIKLVQDVIELESISVSVESEEEHKEEVMNIRTGQMKLKPREIKTSATFIQPDLFRSIQTLPGVVSVSDYSSGLYVRGGNSDHNLILYDEIPVYNPSHLFGVFSTFITDALRDSKLIKSAYPAEYGGRLGSVLDIRSRDGNKEQFEGNISASLFAGECVLTGPVFDGGYLIAARRSYVDPILKMLGDEYPSYYFWDGQGQLYQDFGPDDRLIFSTYAGSDNLSFRQVDMDMYWGNDTYALRWRHVFSPKLYSNFKLSFSRFTLGMDAFGSFRYDNEINDISLKNTNEWFISNDLVLKTGIESQRFYLKFDESFGETKLMDVSGSYYIHSIFADLIRSWDSKFTLKPGLRIEYNPILNDTYKFSFSPRLSVKYMLPDMSSLTISGGRYYQSLFTVQQENQSLQIMDNWFPVDDTVDPGICDNAALSYESTRRIGGGDYKFTAEIYYKYMQNLQNWKETTSATDDVIEDMEIGKYFIGSHAHAYGIELMAERQFGRLNGNVSYTYGKVRKTIDDPLEDDDTFDAHWDIPHSFKSSVNFHLNKKWSFGSVITYSTGRPYTENTGYYTEIYEDGSEEIIAIKGKRNRMRYPDYFRWDISVNYTWFYKNGSKLLLNTSVLNVTDRENIQSYIYDQREDDRVVKDVFPMLPILPSVRLSYTF